MAEHTRLRTALWVVVPLVLLAGLVLLLLRGNAGLLDSGAPPVEELTIERISLPQAGVMEVEVVNGGPSPVTIAQVLVDEAYWQFDIRPGPEVPRLGRATLQVNYPWVETEPHEVVLVTSTGVTFDSAVDVSLSEPARDASTLLRFLLLGFYVGVVPVALGMLWYPALKRISLRTMVFVLSLTVGLLAFLFVDTLLQAVEIAEALPESYQPAALVVFIALLTVLLIEVVGSFGKAGRTPLGLAALVALGIGLHNFGEGLAIGSAYTLGEVALGSFLVIGFTLHNVTEGLAIAAPLATAKPRLRDFAWLVLLAGAPAMLGTWIGVYAYSPLSATVFLAVGAGAIAQVVYQVGRYTQKTVKDEGAAEVPAWAAATGFAVGVLIMYATALVVAA